MIIPSRPLAHPTALIALVSAIVVLTALLVSSGEARGQGLRSVPPAVHVLPVGVPAGAVDVGRVPDHTPVSIRVVLPPRDRVGLDAFVSAVSAPGASTDRGYLTPGEFTARFGPTVADVDAVRQDLIARGLTPGRVAPNRLSIAVDATAAEVASAFDTAFVKTRLRDGRVVRRQTRAARVPRGASTIVGLNDIPRTRRTATADPIPRAACAGADAGSGWTAQELATAYAAGPLYDRTAGGVGQTIALYELSSYKTSDVATAQTCFGSTGKVSRVPVSGGATSSSGALEVTLDAGIVLGQAPSADVLIYEGPNSGTGPLDTFSAIINQNRAQIISVSWGLCEPLVSRGEAEAENTLFAQAAAQGQSIFVASGDDGSSDCRSANGSTALAVDDPAGQPYVTAVGGTTLSSVNPRTEAVWNNGSGAGGGGLSRNWPAPAYQAGVIAAASHGGPCGSTTGVCRQVPDVSASSDPAFGYPTYCTSSGCRGGWSAVGGTSGAAPLWAGFAAVINEYCGSGNQLGFANPRLYAARALLNDVTDGNNGTGVHAGTYPATAGYDLASGLGTPAAADLAFELCGIPSSAAKVTPVPGELSFGAVASGTSVDRAIHLRSVGGSPATIGTTSILGNDASSFSVVTDGCTGQILRPTQGCDVVVRFSPATAGAKSARLELNTDADAGVIAAPLLGAGDAPRTTYAITPSPVAFGSTTVGTATSKSAIVTNTGASPLYVGAVSLTGSSAYSLGTETCSGSMLAPGGTCSVAVLFRPTSVGTSASTLVVPDAVHNDLVASASVSGRGVAPTTTTTATTAPPPPTTSPPAPPPPVVPRRVEGYWMIGAGGDTYAFGDARWFGNTSSAAEVVDLEPTTSGNGYWTVDAVGRVRAYGDAADLGGAPALPAGEQVTSLSRSGSGGGYWLFTSTGRVLAFGDAPFLGDLRSTRLNGPVLDSIPTSTGSGYYMVASDGGIFTFGDADFRGSMGDQRLNAPVQSLVPDADDVGYWLVASDGGVFAFDAPFHGSMGSVRLNRPVTGMVGSGSSGYLMVGEDGGIFTFGDAVFAGSLGDRPPARPITSVAPAP